MAADQFGRRRSMSAESRSASGGLVPSPPLTTREVFDPCASTASLFLYGEGSAVVCLHHDTLAVERRFERHQEIIQFICVDNVSERGAGRLVVSYDVGQTAIIWDLFTGHEISRFASFEHIKTSAWMRNGNVSFGNAKGEVILFEPSTSEHISSRTIFDPIISLAPASDCRTYAIGYQNGSILVANLHPNFTILHTLTTSRAPSPIVSLAWHASSTKQKSDMLASQTHDGDLLVWSVAKHPSTDAPRIIRSLKRSEFGSVGPKWLAWSKNGRIIQYAERETWAWDVRTKHVTYEPIPTVQGVRGMANYGPTATLFTLGPNHTVQQYDLENPSMVANVQHIPGSGASKSAPVEPPKSGKSSETALTSENLSQKATLENKNVRSSPSPGTTAPVFDAAESANQDRAGMASPLSDKSRVNSFSSTASSNRYNRGMVSPLSRSVYSGTTFSMSSPVRSISDLPLYTGNSLNYPSSVSLGSARSYRGGSRLRHEITTSPVDKPITELFPYTRSRLNDVPYQPPRPLGDMHSSPDDLRRQMLTVVFGWTGDIEDLIKDEFGRHAAGTQNAAILARWLAHLDPSIMTSMIASGPSSFDWMLLALSQLDNQTQNKKLGQEFVQKLLAKGDIHGSAAVLLGLGEHNDAIEVYVSRCQFMEAILMTCLVMPIEWERQSYLVRKWGEHVVQNSQQHLAIRCFSCTNGDLSEPWALSTAQMTSLLPTIPNLPETGSDSASKTASKNPALKLITSFSPNPGPSFRFPGLVSADRTPTNGPGVTPIAESATVDSATRSPGMGYYYRQNSGRTLSARTTTPVGFTKQRLSSIGETPIDVASPRLLPEPRNSLPTPAHSGSEREKDGATAEKDGDSQKQPAADEAPPTLFLTSARYDPTGDAPKGETPQTAVATAKGKADWTEQSASPGAVRSLEGKTSNRNSSRDRNPEGLHIQWPPADPNQQGEYLPSTMRMSASFANYGSNGDHGISPALTTDSNRSARSASASVRSIDQYISSLDEATYYSRAQRPSRSERRNADTTDTSKKSHKKQSSRASSKEARGRSNQRYIQPAKRSPSSPIPMSPEDLALYTSTADTNEENARTPGRSGRSGSRQRGGSHRARAGSMSQVDNRGRSRSNTRPADIITTRGSSRNGMRQHSPEGADFRKPHTTPRGRSRQKEKSSGLRSPSSPLPMSPPDAEGGRHGDVEDSLRLVNGDRKQRLRSQQRNQVRRPERGTSARRDVSPDRRRERDRSQSRSAVDGEREPARDFASDSKSGHRYSHSMNEVKLDITDLAPESSVNIGQSPLNEMSERSRKELAAAELEARRLSLARRPSAPAIPMPGEFHYPPTSRSRQGDSPVSGKSFSQRVTGKSTVSPAYSNYSDTSSRGPSSVPVGLPATPRAMRHPKYSTGYHDYNAPAVPDVPDNMSLHDQSPRNIAHATSRSMSAPIPDEADMVDGVPTHPHFHRQLPSSRISKYSFDAGRPSPGTSRKASIDQAMEDSVSPTTNTTSGNPPLLPELQHLQAPPPPPPAPPAPPSISTDDRSSLGSGVGTINIAMEDPPPGSGPSVFGEINVAQRPATTSTAETAPASGRTSVEHRRGRSVNENISSKLRSLTTRMRSTSRGANSRSPSDAAEGASPYESVSIVRVMDNKL